MGRRLRKGKNFLLMMDFVFSKHKIFIYIECGYVFMLYPAIYIAIYLYIYFFTHSHITRDEDKNIIIFSFWQCRSWLIKIWNFGVLGWQGLRVIFWGPRVDWICRVLNTLVDRWWVGFRVTIWSVC